MIGLLLKLRMLPEKRFAGYGYRSFRGAHWRGTAALKAPEIDPELGEAHASLGYLDAV